MPGEYPGAYDEARKRIRESRESETIIIEKKKEDFEKGKEKIYSKKKLDVFELKRRIETGQSLASLRDQIGDALAEGEISIDTYQKAIESIRQDESILRPVRTSLYIDPDTLPFSQNNLAQYLESQKLGASIGVDMLGFFYGFVAQGSAIMIIIAWNLLLDLLRLPRDIYHEITSL